MTEEDEYNFDKQHVVIYANKILQRQANESEITITELRNILVVLTTNVILITYPITSTQYSGRQWKMSRTEWS